MTRKPSHAPISRSPDRVELTRRALSERQVKIVAGFLLLIGLTGVGIFVCALIQTGDKNVIAQRAIQSFDTRLASSPIFAALSRKNPEDYRQFLAREHKILKLRPDNAQWLMRTDGYAFVEREMSGRLLTATPATIKAWGQFKLDIYRDWYADSEEGLFDALTNGGKAWALPAHILAKFWDPNSVECHDGVAVIDAPPAVHPYKPREAALPVIARLSAALTPSQSQAMINHYNHRAVDKEAYVQAILTLYFRALQSSDDEAAAFFLAAGSGSN